MPACCGDFERTLRMFLSAHIGEIVFVARMDCVERNGSGGAGRERLLTGQECHGLRQRMDGLGLHTVDQRRFLAIGIRQEQIIAFPAGKPERKGAGDGFNATVQRQLA